nr:hypothetical protein OH820_34835 [Streptomyces sp. NBC_00857]
MTSDREVCEISDIISQVRQLTGPPYPLAHRMVLTLAGQGVRFWSDIQQGLRVARTILGPYCDIENGASAEHGADRHWTVYSYRLPDYSATVERLLKVFTAAGISPVPIRRWPGDFASDRYDFSAGRSLVVHRRPFLGLTVFSRDERTLRYLRPDNACDVSHTEHVLKYPLRVTLRQAGAAQMHAAGCAFRGRGLLLMGHKGSGKSTLLCRLMSRGARQVSNDLSFALRTPNGAWEMIAFPHITRVARGTVDDNRTLHDALEREERTGDYMSSPVFNGGKEEFYFPVLERIWGTSPLCRSAPLDLIVFPSFDERRTVAAARVLPSRETRERVLHTLVDDPPLPDWLPFMSAAEFRSLASNTAESLLASDPQACELTFGPSGSDPVGAMERLLAGGGVHRGSP